MAGPSRFEKIEAEPVTVTKPSRVTGPRRLVLMLIEPTDLGDRRAQVSISEDMLVIPSVFMMAYRRLQELLQTE